MKKRLSQRASAEIVRNGLRITISSEPQRKKHGRLIIPKQEMLLTLPEAYQLFGLLYDNVDLLASQE